MGHFSKHWLEKTQEKVSKRRGHFSTHGCAVDLKVVVIIKREIIHGLFMVLNLKPVFPPLKVGVYLILSEILRGLRKG